MKAIHVKHSINIANSLNWSILPEHILIDLHKLLVCSHNLFHLLKHMTYDKKVENKTKHINQVQQLRSQTLSSYLLCVLSELSSIHQVSTSGKGKNTCRCVFILYIKNKPQ